MRQNSALYGTPNAPKFSLTQSLRPHRFIDFVAFFGTVASVFTNVRENVFTNVRENVFTNVSKNVFTNVSKNVSENVPKNVLMNVVKGVSVTTIT